MPHRCRNHDIPPARAATGNREEDPGSPAAAGDRTRRPRAARKITVTVVTGGAGGSAWYAGGGTAHTAIAVTAAAAAAVFLAVVVSAMLGRDRRSPFERLMLVLCVALDRTPRDYLPPGPGQDRAGAVAGRAAPAIVVVPGQPGGEIGS